MEKYQDPFQPFLFAEHLYKKRYPMKITIPKPCHENWDQMSIDEQGRFCSVCSKTVRDFTHTSDDELIDELRSDQNVCGRFSSYQLGRNFNFSIISKLTFGLFAFSGAVFTVNGQQLKEEEVKKIDFKKGIDGLETVSDTLRSRSIVLGMPSKEYMESLKPMILLDNKRISEDKMKRLKPENVKSVLILSGDGARKKYGESGEHGVIVIESKRKK